MQTEQTISMKATRDDLALINKLIEKLGVGKSQILRMAIRVLAKNQKVTLN